MKTKQTRILNGKAVRGKEVSKIFEERGNIACAELHSYTYIYLFICIYVYVYQAAKIYKIYKKATNNCKIKRGKKTKSTFPFRKSFSSQRFAALSIPLFIFNHRRTSDEQK